MRMVHINQMKNGLITYDDDYMYHRKSKESDLLKKLRRSKRTDGK